MGPIEALQILSWTNKLELYVIAPTLDLMTTALPEGPISVSGPAFGVRVAPTHSFDTVPDDLEVLIIPGGFGVTSPTIGSTIEFVKKTYPKLKYLITVCNGADVAARAGVLNGKRATTNKMMWKSITDASPGVQWVKTARFIVDGNCWTSGGVSAGIDATLAWIKEVYGEEKARNVANLMEYEWRDDRNWDPFGYMFKDDIIEIPGL